MKIKSIDGNEPFDDIQNNSMNIRSIYILQKVAFKYGLRFFVAKHFYERSINIWFNGNYYINGITVGTLALKERINSHKSIHVNFIFVFTFIKIKKKTKMKFWIGG